MLRLVLEVERRLGELVRPLREARLRERRGAGQAGQTTAEYALVILAAAAIALVLLAWARSSGRLPAFFDQVIDRIIGDSQ